MSKTFEQIKELLREIEGLQEIDPIKIYEIVTSFCNHQEQDRSLS